MVHFLSSAESVSRHLIFRPVRDKQKLYASGTSMWKFWQMMIASVFLSNISDNQLPAELYRPAVR